MKVPSLLKRVLRKGRPPSKTGLRAMAPGGIGRPEDLSPDVNANVASLRAAFGDSADFYARHILVGGSPAKKIVIVFLRSMVDLEILRESLTNPVTAIKPDQVAGLSGDKLIDRMRVILPLTRGMETVSTLGGAVSALLEGRAIGLVPGASMAVSASVVKTSATPLHVPTSELTVLGPQVGFNESVEEGVSLIRTRLRTPDLRVERMVIGRNSQTEVRLLYVDGIAPPDIVSEVRRRLQGIDTDMILDAGMIRNLIVERPFSPFLQERLTERPDTVAAELNHGLAAVLVDGSPFALLLPSQFFASLESPEDYYMHSWAATVTRIVRLGAFATSLLAAPLYVAAVTFHHELIPLPLLNSIAATQEHVPSPLAVTAFATDIILEIVREASLRLPQQYGPAVGIVGALVLGQAAIQAGFIPPGLVIVTMTAAIASFALPRAGDKAFSYRLLRFPFLLAASILGFPGLALAALAVTYHLASLKTLGVPYFTLYTPGNVARLLRKVVVAPTGLQPKTRALGHKDTVLRGPPPKPRDPSEYRGSS